MTLSQDEVIKSAVMAQIITKEKSLAELRALSVQLATEALRDSFAEQFRAQLAGMLQKTINELSIEFVRDLTERIHKNVQHKLRLADNTA